MVACETQDFASLLGLIAVGESMLNAKYCVSRAKKQIIVCTHLLHHQMHRVAEEPLPHAQTGFMTLP